MMAQLDPIAIQHELRRRQKNRAEGDLEAPDGVAWLRDMLSDMSDPEDRYLLYQVLGTELSLNNDFDGALENAKNRLIEFDDIVSRGHFAQQLLEAGRDADAVREFQLAFDLALKDNVLVNYTFGEFMRALVKLGDRETMNRIGETFLAHEAPQSREDCALESDWLDGGESLGVQPEIITEIRRRAGII